jgi:DNA-binding NarL/FixJ family response regulator
VEIHPEHDNAHDERAASVLDPAELGSTLTRREREVLLALSEGLSNRSIAGRLGITEKTVKNHLASIFAKLGAKGRTQAALIAVRMDLA